MSLPLVILGGRGAGKRRDTALEKPANYGPGALGDRYKLLLPIAGTPLIERSLEVYTSLQGSHGPLFDPIYIAGPRKLFREYAGERNGSRVCRIDTDGELYENLNTIRRTLLRKHPHSLVTLAAGDLLPSHDDLSGLAALLRKHEATVDALYPLVRTEALQEIGIEKQTYHIVDREGKKCQYSFGQLYCLRPAQLRWDLIEVGAKVVYERRKEGFMQGFGTMGTYFRLAGVLLKPRNIRSAPFIAAHAIAYSHRVGSGKLSLADGEQAVAALLLYNDPRRKRARRFVVELTDFSTLAADIDTLTEQTATEHRLRL